MPTEDARDIVSPEDVTKNRDDNMAVEDAIRVLTGQQTYAETLQTILNFLYRIIEYQQRLQHEIVEVKGRLYGSRLDWGHETNTPDFEKLYKGYWDNKTNPVDNNTATLTYNDLLNAIKALEQRDQVVYPIIWNTEQMAPDKGKV